MKYNWFDSSGEEYEETFCGLCDVETIICPLCMNTACDCSGCDKCEKAFNEYIELLKPFPDGSLRRTKRKYVQKDK